MALDYQHSRVMQAVTAHHESIPENYSSSQYMEVLDKLLYNAVGPIVRTCKFADSFLSDVLHLWSLAPRRKISNLPKPKARTLMLLLLVSKPEDKAKVLRRMRLERSIVAELVGSWLSALENYKDACESGDSETANKLSNNVGYFNTAYSLYAAVNDASFWFKQYTSFKEKILQKFLKLCATQAQACYKANDSRITLDDLIQNYILYAGRAIDKFDPKKGTLGSYIQTWFQHARDQTVIQENGVAFVLPKNKRLGHINNVATDLYDDDVLEIDCGTTVPETVAAEAVVDRVRYLASLVDPTGLGRFTLGIEQYISKSDAEKQLRLGNL